MGETGGVRNSSSKAFGLGAFGGPATEPPEDWDGKEDWEKYRERVRLPVPGTNATGAERRAYVGKALAEVWNRNPPVDAVVPFGGDVGWAL